MKSSTKTLLYVLGGVALVGGAGTAIYLATKKTDATSGGGVLPKGSSPTGGSTPSGGTTNKTPGITATMPSELGSFAAWLSQHSQLLNPDTGDQSP